MLQLGLVSAILPDLSLEELVRFTADSGSSALELMCWPVGKAARRYAGVTHINAVNFTKGDAARVNEIVASAGLSISGLGYYPNPLAPDDEEAQVAIDHIKQVVLAAELLGVGVINTFVGRDWTKSVDDNWPRFLEVWRPLVKFAEDHGVKIGVENCPMAFTNDEWPGGKNLAHTPAIWRRMFADIPSDHFGLNYDPSHMIWQHMDYLKPIREFSDKLFHIHAKDARLDQHRLDDVGIMATPLAFHAPKLPGLGAIRFN